MGEPVADADDIREAQGDVLVVVASDECTIVETKLATNPELRRKVLAQVLDYLSHLADEFDSSLSLPPSSLPVDSRETGANLNTAAGRDRFDVTNLGPAGFQDQGLLGLTMKRRTTQFALCLDNSGNEASLIRGKVYRAIPDARAAKDSLLRVVDESGDDYLFARAQFAIVDFPQSVRRKLLALQGAG